MTSFTSHSLPKAIASLFRLNHYTVEESVKVNGAEIDLIATPLGHSFAPVVYIEATVEYVDNTKYGKDLTKLSMVREMDPAASCVIVSAKGFTPDVRERARATRFETLTYRELFERFEKFQPYVELMTGETEQATALQKLADVYEPPRFDDSYGSHDALSWMDDWLEDSDRSKSWLIIVGEYGTGKSALTRMLQKSWLEAYKDNAEAPIPIRIELGDFTKQFDAQGLLHHFLDHNRLSHVSIDFFWSLIRSGRVVLILDGYDEMAQYLTQRERRSTLKALAELSGDGVRGILTSRPNYFSETEELALFDHLYREMSLRSEFAESIGEKLRKREHDVDELIQRSILDRYERSLRDLSPEQSRALVRKTLSESPDAAETVVSVLDRVFRTTEEGAKVALSGKPVIISYLIQVASTLHSTIDAKLSEWEVYSLIVDQLALRDMDQTAHVRVNERRTFLQTLAISLTKSGQGQINEEQFCNLIERAFSKQLRKYSGSTKAEEIDNLFKDLRRSGTLTRGRDGGEHGWKFSHNSLREFLVAESMVEDLENGTPLRADPPISDAVRTFVVSRTEPIDELVEALTRAWTDVNSNPAVGSYLTMIWDAIPKNAQTSPFELVAGRPPRADGVHLASVHLSDVQSPGEFNQSSFRSCTLIDVSFRAAHLSNSDFSGSLLEAVSFDEANLSLSNFTDSVLVDVSLAGANLSDANFTGVNEDVSLIIDTRSGRGRIEGKRALGYIAYHGGKVDHIDDYYKWINHPRFTIIEKIASKLVEGGPRQRLGLEQRGASAFDPRFARKFIKNLESLQYVETPLGRPELVEITARGRAALGAIQSESRLPREFVDFLSENA